MRLLFEAGLAPGGPEVENNELALEIGESKRFSIEGLDLERRCAVADGDERFPIDASLASPEESCCPAIGKGHSVALCETMPSSPPTASVP
jgi:hypothetical protein